MTKWKPFSFAMLSQRVNHKIPVLIVQEVHGVVNYRPVRTDGKLGAENTILARSERLKDLKGTKFTLHVDGVDDAATKNAKDWEVALPGDNGEWVTLKYPCTKAEALRVAKETFGADTMGRIYIARRVLEITDP
jgi:hypothetical protein